MNLDNNQINQYLNTISLYEAGGKESVAAATQRMKRCTDNLQGHKVSQLGSKLSQWWHSRSSQASIEDLTGLQTIAGRIVEMKDQLPAKDKFLKSLSGAIQSLGALLVNPDIAKHPTNRERILHTMQELGEVQVYLQDKLKAEKLAREEKLARLKGKGHILTDVEEKKVIQNLLVDLNRQFPGKEFSQDVLNPLIKELVEHPDLQKPILLDNEAGADAIEVLSQFDQDLHRFSAIYLNGTNLYQEARTQRPNEGDRAVVDYKPVILKKMLDALKDACPISSDSQKSLVSLGQFMNQILPILLARPLQESLISYIAKDSLLTLKNLKDLYEIRLDTSEKGVILKFNVSFQVNAVSLKGTPYPDGKEIGYITVETTVEWSKSNDSPRVSGYIGQFASDIQTSIQNTKRRSLDAGM